MTQVFVSHTKRDNNFCNAFDVVCARVGVKAFRSEFETITVPHWKTIKKEIDASVALFFLVGQELVKSQDSNDTEWRHTQNWIAYEIGLACEKPIDVWAICDDVSINFPMPYINNYLTISLRHEDAFYYLKFVLGNYSRGKTFPFPYTNVAGKTLRAKCPHKDCQMMFNLHQRIQPPPTRSSQMPPIRCPQCLNNIDFPEGHLV